MLILTKRSWGAVTLTGFRTKTKMTKKNTLNNSANKTPVDPIMDSGLNVNGVLPKCTGNKHNVDNVTHHQ